jgi:6-phosphogluconolactonase
LKNSVKIFSTPSELAEKFAEELILWINEAEQKRKPISVALSGGSTPVLLFSVLGDKFSGSVHWEYVHFFWSDERCVPPDSSDSNYRMTRNMLFDKILIPSSNIHRILGENDPECEALRYSDEIDSFTEKRNGQPLFDIIILGIGEDGHIASIFPGNLHLFNSGKICEVAIHPVTLQKRITMTGRVINNANSVTILVTGRNKAAIVEKILHENPFAKDSPASHIVPSPGELRWFLDREAGSLL